MNHEEWSAELRRLEALMYELAGPRLYDALPVVREYYRVYDEGYEEEDET